MSRRARKQLISGVLGGVAQSDVIAAVQNKIGVVPYTNASTAGLTAFDTWFGRSSDFAMVFITTSNWTIFDSSVDTLISNYAGDTRPKIWTVGPNVTGTSLDDAAAGLFNSHYLTAAQKILADAPATGFIFIRIGHEFNLAGTYPWEVINSGKWAQFAGAFQQVVGQFRSVSNRFRFIWCPNWITTPSSVDLTPAYPGNAYVDIVGTDLYYSSNTDNATPLTAFQFERDLTFSGLNAIRAFARARGRAFAICEFGTNWDKPQWYDLVWSWMQANGPIAWATLWDSNADVGMQSRLSDGTKGYSGDRFIQLFNNGGPVALFQDTFFYGNPPDTGNANFAVTGAAQMTITSGVYPSYIEVTNVSNFADVARQNIGGLTPGRSYRLEFDLNGGTKNAKIDAQDNTSTFASLGSVTANTGGALQHKTFNFTPIGTSVYFRITPFGGDAAQVVRVQKALLFAN
jgi:hypothetical protein